jgi:hypothetical protein
MPPYYFCIIHHILLCFPLNDKTDFMNLGLYKANALKTTFLLLLLRGSTVLKEIWPPHIMSGFVTRNFLRDGDISTTPNPQP